MRNLITFLIFVFITLQVLYSQVTVEGNIFLEGQSNHDSIMVAFERTAPSTLFDTAYTDNNGYYSKIIEEGIYLVSYSKVNYSTVNWGEVDLYSDYVFFDTTLFEGIGGALSGTLSEGVYSVVNDISVDTGETLTIEPGVRLYFHQDVSFTINGSLKAEGTDTDSIVFTRINDTTQWGGIDILENTGICKLDYCLIEHSNDCGIFCDESSQIISNSTIQNNSSIKGGGIRLRRSNTTLQNLVIKDNSAIQKGGGVYCEYCEVVIGNSKIIGNYVSQEGGGLYLDGRSTVLNSIIYNNVSRNYAGGIRVDGFNCSIINCSILKNQAPLYGSGYGAGVYSESDNCWEYITNSIIAYNIGYGFYLEGNISSNDPYISNSLFWENTNGNFSAFNQWIGTNVTINVNGDSIDPYNNIIKDPLFIADTTIVFNGGSPPSYDTIINHFYDSVKIYHLSEFSPCIDAGINDSVTVQIDLDSNTRIWDGNLDGDTIVDIGVYEFDAPPYLKYEKPLISVNEELYSVYPNPVKYVLKISSKETIEETKLYDITGKLQLENTNTDEIDMSSLKPGIYLLKVKTGESSFVRKVIKN